MQKLEGHGLAFVHAGGHIIERELQHGELLKVDTGCVVAYTAGVGFDIEFRLVEVLGEPVVGSRHNSGSFTAQYNQGRVTQ